MALNKFDKIVSESIESYLKKNVLQESLVDMLDLFQEDDDEKKSKKSKKKDSKKSKKDSKDNKKDSKKNKKSTKNNKRKKLKNGLRANFDYDYEDENNPILSDADAAELRQALDNDALDLSQLAQKVFPDHTKEGAQSQFRKKVEGELPIRKLEAQKAQRALSQFGINLNA